MIELKGLDIPTSFLTRSTAYQTMMDFLTDDIPVVESDSNKLVQAVETLRLPQLHSLIDEGKLTLGLVKPQIYVGKNLPDDDEEAATQLITEIGEDKVIFNISLGFTLEQAEEFYGPVKDRLENNKHPDGTPNPQWQPLMDFITSGPFTCLLLYYEDGSAVDQWRATIGKTIPSQAKPDTIRGKYGDDQYFPNNLVHGSDSPAEVKRELGVITKILESFIPSESGI